MDTAPKENAGNVDPLNTLTQEQKIDLRSKVAENLNAFIQSEAGRPRSTSWKEHETYEENRSNQLFERMAWSVLNDNFEKIKKLDPPIVSHIFDYFYDFTTPGHDGSNMLTKENVPWLKKARKNLAEYMLNNFSTEDLLRDDAVAELFIRLTAWAFGGEIELLDEYAFTRSIELPDNYYPMKNSDYRKRRFFMDTSIKKAFPELQRLKEML